MSKNFCSRTIYTILLLVFFAYCGTAQTMGGIGVQLMLDTTTDGYTLPRIKSLVPGGPSEALHLPEGNYIMSVNDISCKNKPMDDVVATIRGTAGTPVTLQLADNPQGKKPKRYTVTRAVIQAPPQPGNAPDPVTIFNAGCEAEAAKLKKQGMAIIKTFNSDCGDYFFNFETDNAPYHVRVYTMEAKTGGAYTKGFEAVATLFDNSDEGVKTPLKSTGSSDQGNSITATLEGVMTMKRNSIGVVNVQIQPLADAKKCMALYVIVYK